MRERWRRRWKNRKRHRWQRLRYGHRWSGHWDERGRLYDRLIDERGEKSPILLR